MNKTMKIAAGATALLVVGALVGNEILGDADAATRAVTLDSANGRVSEVSLMIVPGGGCSVGGTYVVTVPGSTSPALAGIPQTVLTARGLQDACALLMDYVTRRGLAQLQFSGIDAGQ